MINPKNQIKENINSIDSELQKIKEGKEKNLNLEESEKIENSVVGIYYSIKINYYKVRKGY